MQQFLKVLRWSVGLLFIFSGLIKANDPLGLSYKMQEFFDVWGIQFLQDYTLGFAIVMNVLEIITGLALIIKFPYKQTLWLLLGLIIFNKVDILLNKIFLSPFIKFFLKFVKLSL